MNDLFCPVMQPAHRHHHIREYLQDLSLGQRAPLGEARVEELYYTLTCVQLEEDQHFMDIGGEGADRGADVRD